MLLAVAIAGMLASGCANTGRYNTQKGALIGAGLGAVAGQAIGRNTGATLIGTGVGGLIGSVLGNLEDQRAEEARWAQQGRPYSVDPYGPAYEGPPPSYGYPNEPQPYRYVAPEPQVRTEPPGRWVTVPGHWEGNHWVPEHQEWRPIHPY
jgi:hypothetical protein